MLNNEHDRTRFFVSAFRCESVCWRVSHRPFPETSLFVFGAPLKRCLIPSARDSEIFCLTSFRICITLQRTGTGAAHWNEPLSYENLGSSRETNLKVREASTDPYEGWRTQENLPLIKTKRMYVYTHIGFHVAPPTKCHKRQKEPKTTNQ